MGVTSTERALECSATAAEVHQVLQIAAFAPAMCFLWCFAVYGDEEGQKPSRNHPPASEGAVMETAAVSEARLCFPWSGAEVAACSCLLTGGLRSRCLLH